MSLARRPTVLKPLPSGPPICTGLAREGADCRAIDRFLLHTSANGDRLERATTHRGAFLPKKNKQVA